MAKKKKMIKRKRRPSPAASAEPEAFEKPVVRRKKKKVVSLTEPEEKTPRKKPKKTKKDKLRNDWGDPEFNEPEMTHAKLRGKISSMHQGLVKQTTKEFGDPDVCTAGEAGRLFVGVPLPAFSLEYLFQNNALPLGRVLQIVGIEGSYKSGLASEIGHWFVDLSGCVGWFEHESKYSDDWMLSVVGWENGDLVYLRTCDSVNAWQSKLQHFVRNHKANMKGTNKEPGPGMVYPVLCVVDSIVGKSTEETQDTIDKDGSAGRGFPIEALFVTRFMQHFPQKIQQWPMMLVLVNQLKPQQDPKKSNVIHRNKAGGRGKDFQETWELECRAIGKTKVMKDHDEQLLTIINAKNSLGNTHRAISVKVRWWYEEVTEGEPGWTPENDWRQITEWDWHGATTDLLLSENNPYKARMGKIVDLNKTDNGRIWSKTLGIPQKAPVTFKEAGEMIQQNPKVLRALRKCCGVKMRKPFQLGVDYREQLGDAKRRVGKQVFKYK